MDEVNNLKEACSLIRPNKHPFGLYKRSYQQAPPTAYTPCPTPAWLATIPPQQVHPTRVAPPQPPATASSGRGPQATCADERELPRPEPKEQGWSMAAADRSDHRRRRRARPRRYYHDQRNSCSAKNNGQRNICSAGDQSECEYGPVFAISRAGFFININALLLLQTQPLIR